MNRLLTILLLLGATAHGQINNPPTSVNIVDSTATGRAVLTATNAAAAATAVGLGTTNNVTFNRVQVGGASFTADDFSGGDFEITAGHALTFASGGTPGATLTNLGLGTTNNVEFRRLKMIAANATDNGDDATLWLDTSGTNKYATMRISGTGGSAEKYNAYLTAGPNGLNITASPGFRVLNGGTANAGSVVFAVNSSGNATLNGVNNTAPSQTADSASSLMTRDLTDQRQIDRMIAGPRMVWLTTFTGWSTAVSGGSIGQNVFIRASSGTNQWNYAVARNFQSSELFTGSGDVLNFSKAGGYGTAYYSPGANYRDGTDVIYLGAAGTYVPSTGSAVSNPATKGFGWRIKDESIVATMYATNYVEVATDSAVLPSGATTRQNVWLYIDWDGTGAASWYVDGNEIASTTNGPTGLTSVNEAWLIFGSVADIPLTQQNQNSVSAFVLDREP
jgi:hypothetical protein